MKGIQTAKEINEQKWRRMRLILDELKEKPMSSNEIEQLVSGKAQIDRIAKRSVQNYVAELNALGLIFWNPQARVYEIAERKRVFNSKYDYEIVMKHSKKLVLSSKERQRLDHTNPALVVDLLVFEKDRHALFGDTDIDDKCLVQHFPTGYFSDVYALMQNYYRLMEETNLSKIKGLPKLSMANLCFDTVMDQTDGSSIVESFANKNFEAVVNETEFLRTGKKGKIMQIDISALGEEKDLVEVSEEKFKEILDVRNLLIGRIYSIVNDVINGIPLLGYCDYCPDRRTTIKG